MPLVDGRFILIVGPRQQSRAPTYSAVELAVFLHGQVGLDVNIVWMVVVLRAQASSHDALLGRLPVEDKFDDVIQFYLLFLKRVPEGDSLRLVPREPV